MASKRLTVVPFTRIREGKTDYKKRLAMLKSGRTRVIIRKSNKNLLVQAADYKANGDKVILTTGSWELGKLGWKYSCSNIPAAYLTGLLAGKKLMKAGVKNAIVDLGLYMSVKGSRLYAAVKGVADAGIDLPHSKEILPSDDRIRGEHVVKHAQSLKGEGLKKQFSGYLKANQTIDIPNNFDEVKKKIMGN